jgi:putative salt-induced outer membrane protein YdiY
LGSVGKDAYETERFEFSFDLGSGIRSSFDGMADEDRLFIAFHHLITPQDKLFFFYINSFRI